MLEFDSSTPVVMTFSSHDPSGGSGIQADIETLLSVGCHCVPVITTMTAQDTSEIKDIVTVDSTLLIEQARAVLEDMPVKAIKLGMLGSLEVVEAIHTILRDYDKIPVVLDPVTTMGPSAQIDMEYLVEAARTLLLSQATIITPNTVEAHHLSHEADTLDACAAEILDSGAQYVLITGTHNSAEKVTNNLYSTHMITKSFEWPRLTNHYQGAGATLASAIAGYLAHGLSVAEAVEQAQSFTWKSLKKARRLGMGRLIPNRLHWCNVDAND